MEINKENLSTEGLDIDDFREFLESIEQDYNDPRLDMFLKTCINSLWIMYENGYDMPKKALIELKRYL